MGSSKYLPYSLQYEKTSQNKVTVFQGLRTTIKMIFFMVISLRNFKVIITILDTIIYLFFDIFIRHDKLNSSTLITISFLLFNLALFSFELYIY